ncbi:hypothetical protein [Acidimangrovimonas sediminis]|uniref:hypothetical protein n=1 Tax=Acidimangrovimonas sediminis TaxID=2056283 RepID=UPI000C80429E|nr:hypothetical protein [Acidimangrovimonas sediminis]
MGFPATASDMTTLAVLACYLLLANGLGYALYRSGLMALVRRDRPMPIAPLLAVSALGGSLGANLAELRFARALRRYPLKVTLRVIFVGQITVLAALSTPLGPGLMAEIQTLSRTLAKMGVGPQGNHPGPQRIGPESAGAPRVLGWDSTGGHKPGAFGTDHGGTTFISVRK